MMIHPRLSRRTVLAARVTLALAFLGTAAPATAADLVGSLVSMKKQHGVAVERELSFARTRGDVRDRVEKGELVSVEETADLDLAGVSEPYARAEVASFVTSLAAAYREATGSRLVVTSLTRSTVAQPANAHRLSVHPAGMAVDLRVPADGDARTWLERTLLSHERAGRLDVTREKRPPHYHVAVYPAEWATYVDSLERRARATRDSTLAATAESRARARKAVVVQAAATPPEPGAPFGKLGGGLAAAALGLSLAAAGRRSHRR